MVSTACVPRPAAIDFHCHACGRCCNSAPQLTLAELFRWDTRFIGALRLKTRAPWRAGQKLDAGPGASAPMAAEDVDDDAQLARSLAFDLPAGRLLQLSLTAIDYPSLERCPQLQADGLCALHAEGKPVMCATVPLDPWVPDRLQGLVLQRRSAGGPEDLGADCIRSHREHADRPAEFQPLWRDGQIVNVLYRGQLASQRQGLAQERRLWGQTLFEQLQRDHLLASLPPDRETLLPMAPLLLRLALRSPRCRDRITGFLANQAALIDQGIEAAIGRRKAGDRPFTELLRQHLAAGRRLAEVMASMPSDQRVGGEMALETEALLGA